MNVAARVDATCRGIVALTGGIEGSGRTPGAWEARLTGACPSGIRSAILLLVSADFGGAAVWAVNFGLDVTASTATWGTRLTGVCGAGVSSVFLGVVTFCSGAT